MKVTGRRNRPRLRLEPVERELLASLLDQLDELLDAEDEETAAIRDRLEPRAYEDDAAQQEYQALTSTSLREERDERLAACRSDLAGGAEIDLGDQDAGRRWIQVLNDLRLALGTRLAVTEDDSHRIDPDDPDAQDRYIYLWLTATQDAVVQALMH